MKESKNEIKMAEISIKNFRSIKDSTINLAQDTILLGKNNIGKTSLLEAFKAFNYGLKLSDVNLDLLINIMKKRSQPETITKNECIELTVLYSWSNLQAEYWSLLSDISDTGDTKIVIRYSIPEENYPQLRKLDGVKNILDLFTREVWIGSRNDFDNNNQTLLPAYTKLNKYLPVTKNNLDHLEPGELLMCPIMAFRYVDSGKTSNEDTTASQFSEKVSEMLSNDDDTKTVFQNTQTQVDQVVSKSLDPFQEELKKFAYPRNPNHPLKAILTIDEWMANPQIRIAQTFSELKGFELPLNAQGLGYQNIYNILARISAQFSKMKNLGLHNPIFFAIEEPEAFTHPQLQHVFIQQICNFISEHSHKLHIPYQLLIISHSPEVAVSAFEMKFQIVIGRRQGKYSYFINWDSIGGDDSESRDKLKKLIMNYNAEMLFADKLIAYEGNAERLMLTALIRQNVPSLLSEKVAFIPVGTAFNSIKNAISDLRFDKVLLITDLDYKRPELSNNIDNAPHMHTTNGNLRCLFETDLKVTDIDFENNFNKRPKYISNSYYLTPTNKTETTPATENFMIVTQGYSTEFNFWPRTLESALVFASQNNFDNYKKANLLKKNIDTTLKANPYDVNDISGNLLKQGKADFALNSLNLILTERFSIPQYLLKGLNWLAGVEK